MSDQLERNNPQNSLENQIQPTNEPENHPIDDGNDDLKTYIANLEARIASQQIEYRKLQNRVHDVENKKPEPPPTPARNVDKDREGYFTDPIGVLDQRENKFEERLINRIERSLEPIRKVAERFTASDEYSDLKRELKVDPVFSKAMRDQDVMSVVDRMMSSPGVSMDINTLKMAIASASFSKQNGLIANTQQVQPNNINDRGEGRQDTAYLQPSNKRRDPPPQKRELTEDDRLAMRIGGITDPEEYFKLIEEEVMVLPPDKPIGRKEGKK